MTQELTAQRSRQGSLDTSHQPGIEQLEANRDDGPAVIRFRRFQLLPGARQLLADGEPIELGSRAFDLLVVLLESRGSLITKDKIMRRVWPSTVVDECNLRVQMSALRKVLGEDREVIKTIPGRGYVFALDVTAPAPEPIALPPPPGLLSALPAPGPIGQVVGSPRRPWPTGRRPAPSHDGTPPTVVVIDDDRDVRDSLQGLLRSVGLRVELFASVQNFLESDRPNLPGCLILDVRLPGRSGLEFYADLVKANVHLPVIFMSGYADVPMSVRAMKAGAVEFLTKPVRHQDLLDAIQLAMEPAGPRDDPAA
jgi:DNA-binding response OmpR family regulator